MPIHIDKVHFLCIKLMRPWNKYSATVLATAIPSHLHTWKTWVILKEYNFQYCTQTMSTCHFLLYYFYQVKLWVGSYDVWERLLSTTDTKVNKVSHFHKVWCFIWVSLHGQITEPRDDLHLIFTALSATVWPALQVVISK